MMSPRRKDLLNDFVHAAISRAVAGPSADKYALHRFGLNLDTRTAVAGSITADGAFKDESLAFFGSVAEQSVVGQLPLRQVPFDARLTSVATGATGYWTSESAGKALSQVTLSASPLAARKVAAVCAFSDEVMRAAGDAGVALMRNDLIRSCSDSLSAAFLSTAADDGTTPGGILDGVSIVTGNESIQYSLRALMDSFAGDLTRAVWISTPSIYAILAANNHNRVGLNGGFLLGAKAVASRFAPAEHLILVDPELIAIAVNDVQVKSSNNATLQMSDQSGSPLANQSAAEGSPLEPVPTSVVSMFQSNNVAMLAEIAVNWRAQSGAVAAMDCAAWSGGSP